MCDIISSLTSDLRLPFINMAEISPIFHSSGILLLGRLRLDIFSNGSNIISASSFRSLGCTLSGEGDFAIFNDSISFLILSFEIFTSINTASTFLDSTSGKSCIFSFVNTLMKNDDSTSAFSLSFAVLLSSPSSYDGSQRTVSNIWKFDTKVISTASKWWTAGYQNPLNWTSFCMLMIRHLPVRFGHLLMTLKMMFVMFRHASILNYWKSLIG